MHHHLSRLSALTLVVVAAISIAASQTTLRVTALRTEYKINPLGIDQAKPRFSWQIQSTDRGVVQTAYELRVALTNATFGREQISYGTAPESLQTRRFIESTPVLLLSRLRGTTGM